LPTERAGRREIGRVRLKQLPPGAKRLVMRPPFHVLVTNVGGTIHAIEDACPHSGVSLCDGELRGERMTCPGHGWVIDVRTGRVLVPEGIDESTPCFVVETTDEWAIVYEG